MPLSVEKKNSKSLICQKIKVQEHYAMFQYILKVCNRATDLVSTWGIYNRVTPHTVLYPSLPIFKKSVLQSYGFVLLSVNNCLSIQLVDNMDLESPNLGCGKVLRL